MKPIKILDPLVAERIAAGEVVERPASVVKELVENALDAGSSHVSVRLQEGGRALIEVLDNGSGMDFADLKLCTLRHATSKIEKLEDLDRLASLGFRGEALPSIAAVADLQILSQSRSSHSCYQIQSQTLEPEIVSYGHFHGCSHGTRVRVQSLFAQIPARLKFLKSPRAEVAQVREWMERLALIRPEVEFELYSDERQILHLRSSDEIERARLLLGDGNNYPVKSIEKSVFGVDVRLHWMQGLSLPQSKKMVQVVNGRILKDRLIQSALMKPFKQALLPGQYPALALYVRLDPSLLDCNVHPTKTEVRFHDGRIIFLAIERTIDELISKRGAPAFARSLESRSSSSFNSQASLPLAPVAQTMQRPWQASEPAVVITPEEIPSPSAAEREEETANKENQNFESEKQWTGFRFCGSLFQTYLMFEQAEEVWLLDQHAAHERIRYEKLKSEITRPDLKPQSQSLLMPENIRTLAEDRTRLADRLPWLSELGFEAEVFGPNSVVVRSVPASWGTQNLSTRLKNLLERLLALKISEIKDQPLAELLLDEVLFESLASRACRSSIMAGDRLDADGMQAQALFQELFSCQHPWNCPHGRPTVVKLSQTRIEEWFLRKL